MSDSKENVPVLTEEQLEWLNSFPVLSEEDFYPPEDKRYVKSGIRDIRGGDNFEEYMEEFNELCEDEELYDE